MRFLRRSLFIVCIIQLELVWFRISMTIPIGIAVGKCEDFIAAGKPLPQG
jgi:hypothetical protein